MRSRVLQDAGSATLTLRYQVYAFANLFAGRYPTSISTVGGTGCIAPTL